MNDSLPKLLIIDDEPDLADLLAECLEEAFQVTVHTTAIDAIDLIKLERFDVIISDLHMPGATGCEIVEQVMLSQPSTPILVMTGDSPESEAVIKALEKGASGYLSKPFPTMAEVVTLIQSSIKSGGT